ncbi:MAG: zinc dependent phospholipase C family protein [Anaerolineae bacterium]|jgi:hypothetical protein|nr:zinc dependent phospholipase C family protein [Anaerolineae bacterium]
MPTPFSHLAVAQRLLVDLAIPDPLRALLDRQRPAFLLGSVAADARVGNGMPRSTTHFYQYVQTMNEMPPWRIMLQANPSLWQPNDEAHEAFLAGYVAHLAMDEMWSRQMVGPYFLGGTWGDQQQRFVMLHVILIVLDERDERRLEPWQAEALRRAAPHQWLPFLPDINLIGWRDLIYGQIAPGGVSRTLEIFGARASKTPEELRALLDSPAEMNDALWQYVPPDYLAAVEVGMYAHCVSQLVAYLTRQTVWP